MSRMLLKCMEFLRRKIFNGLFFRGKIRLGVGDKFAGKKTFCNNFNIITIIPKDGRFR